jgi:uncharacterized damage-inducible protein DinB
MTSRRPEVWLRGPVPGVPPLLQPVAPALLQSSDEVVVVLSGFPDHLLWSRPAGVASVGFHLRHLTGVVDRLFSYANRDPLTEEQMQWLRAEEVPDPDESVESLTARFVDTVDLAVERLRSVDEASLTEARSVGRAKLPSTVLGLLFHAAEHTQRHVGQLLVTVRVQQPSRLS